ncbi:hypothetical protein A2291_00885 [candidate division WOR-1 bacterium RIFOXYB2_FULL_42_35]|uniref:Sulfatase-modifying factor enzyme domain-containing protein n=1 Tax=candidate division WOR-1 bacterium RIFOXYC2_FULL_41_25 TaxID=1802586 RepID=A0A1F4TLL5_UNCSA|nr:MAG: hypothetical protein A2247_05870 [candidate division WOR-1 bacterium RIFOXYA2_FULL_41_14]OGC23610.1 MAG: hypothetical protein A2291_00885 [candidate division WOR-1 bacterium RIFOXYB2_FULL_42_35]OGC33574.1 MAG: hypothetical protein A2462_02700 [candidate division WOR-1 bacterium RIFOXYC2_FULL_41_25]
MGIAIRGEFQCTPPRVIRAIQRAQATTSGSRAEKEAAGLGVLKKHLGDQAPDSLGKLLAQACLSREALTRAEQFFTEMGAEARKAFLLTLLEQPFLSRPTLFEEPIGEATEAGQTVEAGKLAEALGTRLPEQELIMVPNSTAGEGKSIGRKQVTNEQWAIAMEQAGLRCPYHKGELDDAVVGVNYETDVVGFADWQGMRAPRESEFLDAKKAGILSANKPWEWMADNEKGSQIGRSLRCENRYYCPPSYRYNVDRAFRVAEG